MAGTIKHEWDGTTLIITSDSGTSAMDLKGEKGDMGVRGPMGAQGCVDTSLVYTTNNPPTAAEVGAVPTNRKINEKELNEDIILAAEDVAAAPAGYGLGENVGKNTLTADANDLIYPGWYRCSMDTLNNPYGAACVIRVDSINESSVTQTAYHYYPTRNSSKVRTKEGSTWSDWVDCSPSAFAPAGFGLGIQSTSTAHIDTLEKLNNLRRNGWFAFTGGNTGNTFAVSGITFSYGGGRIDTYNGDNLKMWLMSYNPSNHTQKYEIVRYMHQGVWSEWEWVNPPMNPGTEYRTTERWMGKPVYTMLVDCGTLPAVGSVKEIGHGAGSGSDIISFNGHMSSHDSLPYINYGGVAGAAENVVAQINLSVTPSNIKIATIKWGYESTNPIAGITAKVQIKYVKN